MDELIFVKCSSEFYTNEYNVEMCFHEKFLLKALGYW
jgi:hypothetical protein